MKKDVTSSEAAATWELTGSLVPWDQNPRINDHAVDGVASSIKRFGFGAPLVARREDRMIIAGHTRHLAALSLKLEKVPVRFLDLDPADARLLALADNKIGESAAWDEASLASIFSEMKSEGLDLSLSGFDSVEISALLGEWEDPFGDEQPPESIEDPSVRSVRAVVPIGDLDSAVEVIREALKAAGIEAEVKA
jgi:ParB-like chromosome segregation protein Spo0J